MQKSRFAIHYHQAKRAGNHFDIRFKQPTGTNWDSFATKKEIPLKTSDSKIIVFRTRVHSEKEALFTGEIESGYGAGKLSLYDEGDCEFERYSKRHIAVRFHGKKIKGIYHFISIAYSKAKSANYGKKAYLFFKGKDDNYEG